MKNSKQKDKEVEKTLLNLIRVVAIGDGSGYDGQVYFAYVDQPFNKAGKLRLGTRSDYRQGKLTVAYQLTKARSAHEDARKIRYAFAACAPEDNFCKRTGRILALRKFYAAQRDGELKLGIFLDDQSKGLHLNAAAGLTFQLTSKCLGMPRWWQSKA